ncbi:MULTISPECIES: GUN4 domain-containing protein [unclassified Microcoleus]|uniref:GUN4 domain-containing protein n=1 Tax=unclassified Microcoleus TaxID=2642155 RepID=UPI0040409682
MDQLWVRYSNGRFGFSVQKRIYESLGGTREYHNLEIWEAFGDRVGWRVNSSKWLHYNDLKFNTQAPIAHLPGCWRYGVVEGIQHRFGLGRVMYTRRPLNF